MKTISIFSYNRIKLNSFHPLCKNVLGRKAIERHNLAPFIDASCRREPDFENPRPSISALCRQGNFAPHLKLGDIVVYITVGGNYPPYNEKHHRLVAILQVDKIYNNHLDAYNDYAISGDIPRNCMVAINPPCKFDQTVGKFKDRDEYKSYVSGGDTEKEKLGKKLLDRWDRSYQWKARKWSSFIRTNALYVNVKDPKPIFREHFDSVFGKLPNTRNPNHITATHLKGLGKIAGLKIII